MDALQAVLVADLQAIRTQSPLVLNLTNAVAMDFTANALLAIGASPIMSQAEEELTELIALSNAIVINMGTIDKTFISSSQLTIRTAEKLGKPIVLDPVGVGASQFRTNYAQGLLESKAITVVRGNASEISSLLGDHRTTKGVDSTLSSSAVLEDINNKIKDLNIVIVASGETDYVFSKNKTVSSEHGCSLMTRVTAMGCVATSLLGAFLAVSPTSFQAALHTMIVMGIAGEIAGQQTTGPGSFRVKFLDALFGLQSSDFSSLKVKSQ